MIKPTEADIGRIVVYRSYNNVEQGVITSFNDHCVHVRYGSDTGSKGTLREDLEFILKPKAKEGDNEPDTET